MITEPVEITIDYLNKHKTKKGAWTKKQILALGLTWPLQSGWKSEILGNILTAEKAFIFETENVAKSNNKQVKNKMTIDKCIEYLFKNANAINHHQLVRLRNVESKYMDFAKRKLSK